MRQQKRKWYCSIQGADLIRGFGSNAEAKGDIVHVIDDNASILRNSLRNTSQSSLRNVVSIEEGHFSTGLNPHLILDLNGSNESNTWAYLARKSRAVIWSRNLWFLLKRPNLVPILVRLSLPKFPATFSRFSLEVTVDSQKRTWCNTRDPYGGGSNEDHLCGWSTAPHWDRGYIVTSTHQTYYFVSFSKKTLVSSSVKGLISKL